MWNWRAERHVRGAARRGSLQQRTYRHGHGQLRHTECSRWRVQQKKSRRQRRLLIGNRCKPRLRLDTFMSPACKSLLLRYRPGHRSPHWSRQSIQFILHAPPHVLGHQHALRRTSHGLLSCSRYESPNFLVRLVHRQSWAWLAGSTARLFQSCYLYHGDAILQDPPCSVFSRGRDTTRVELMFLIWVEMNILGSLGV
jgi:hypothetical protein